MECMNQEKGAYLLFFGSNQQDDWANWLPLAEFAYNYKVHAVGGISVHCKTRLQVPDSRVRAWSQQSCLRRDKIQYFGKVLQNSPLAAHKIKLNCPILTMILPCP